jgi:DNA-binding CsgD family transcriptional regulator
MSADLEAFNEVVGGIYQAALDAQTWDEALTRFISHYAPPLWGANFLLWERPPELGARFVASANLAAHAREIYATNFAGANPWSRALSGVPLGRVVCTDDLCSREELFESALYKHFLSNWQMTRALVATLDRDGRARLAWVMPGPDGQDLTHLQRGMRLLAPHIQRAVRISRRIAEADLRAGAAEASLALCVSGIFALRDDLSIVNANPASRSFIEDGAGRIADGRWTFAERAAQAELERLAGAATPASAAFTARNREGDEHAVIAVRIPAQSAFALDGYVEGASILMTVGAKGKAPSLPVDHLAAWYGLTPAEATLAASMADGQTVREFAIRRGVTENAVRFLMKGVLRKTGAADQARLVAALRGLPMASLGSSSPHGGGG